MADTPSPTVSPENYQATFPPIYYDSPLTDIVLSVTILEKDSLTAAITAGAPFFKISSLQVCNFGDGPVLGPHPIVDPHPIIGPRPIGSPVSIVDPRPHAAFDRLSALDLRFKSPLPQSRQTRPYLGLSHV